MLASSESRSDSTVAGILRDTIAVMVALISEDSYRANREASTVMPAATPKAR
jgi:hypothetical protein